MITRMSCSTTFKCHKILFKVDLKYTSAFYHKVSKSRIQFGKNNTHSQFLIRHYHGRLNSSTIFNRQRYSFGFPLKSHIIKNSNVKQSTSLGSIDNDNVPLTKSQAEELILKLTEEERKTLLAALQEYNSNQVKTEYEGQLAATRWRSRFGRPSKLPTLGDVDPTGSYCHLPEDWLKQKYAEKVPKPTTQQLIRVALFNAVPFVGFGFLDNFIMIVAGDYIDETVGSLVTISTMAAAALGNTISDVMGIGSAWYVELAASKIGLKPPNLSPIQLDMKHSRRASNLGRVCGIIVGCLLGMLPLLFIKKENVQKKETE